ncbi:hypothetical protein [Candidatus Nesciobacter abundans]|uniref:DNA-directed RNA polymerase RpoA/D/Rpb3-type domain-containing protein n=1 Tax=Candidatus Nesciobacter abundans TaxID=2601668 RepID=A0A5C0UJD9_9PROT|nr:hypothetical protein [Candidatus Nesciobacter abundans]QEK38924.1 hypothetical protein FZC36_00525 [Candidatus Nesciobacter abundans]
MSEDKILSPDSFNNVEAFVDSASVWDSSMSAGGSDDSIPLEQGELRGVFEHGPLKPGYSVTLGNPLRRVLMSSIEGVALCGIKIKDVHTELSSKKGAKEDVAEIIINMKNIVFKADIELFTFDLIVEKSGKVFAKDLDLPNGIEILNKDAYLFTLDDSASLEISLVLKKGIGYSQANDITLPDESYIKLDAVFSPIKRVVFSSASTMVGQNTEYEILVVEIVTNGFVEPGKAYKQASEILVNEFGRMHKVFDEVKETEEELEEVNESLFDLISADHFPLRAVKVMHESGMTFVGDIVVKNKEDLMKMGKVGSVTINKVINVLESKYGFSLETEIENWESLRNKRIEETEEEGGE